MSTIATERIRTQALRKPGISIRHRRVQMYLLMLLADLCGFAAGAVIFLLNAFWNLFDFNIRDLEYLAIPLFCLILFMNSKLYPGLGVNPAEEIKLVTKYVTTGFVSGWIMVIWMQAGWAYTHFAFPILWGLCILSVLLFRWIVRIQAVKLGLWGEPVMVIGRGQHVNRTITYFAERKRLGYIPVLAAIDSMENQPGTSLVPMIEYGRLFDSNVDHFQGIGIQTALVDVPAISEFLRSDESKALFRIFRRVILVSDLNWIDGASMHVQDFEGMIGIAAEKVTLTRTSAFLKRALDVGVALIAGVILTPFMFVAAIWIKLDSPGPALYVQERLGKDRRRMKRPGEHWRKIKVYKFRSMVRDADRALDEYLQAHPDACSEWETNHKLPNDPRITRAGRLLRKFSIDELPQLFNVLKGEMSLVGPRPLPPDHYRMLTENLRNLRATLRPGLTGMWQVSGRSNSGTAGMEMWDSYYIHNWSIWLDIYILLRTVWVVLNRNGAY